VDRRPAEEDRHRGEDNLEAHRRRDHLEEDHRYRDHLEEDRLDHLEEDRLEEDRLDHPEEDHPGRPSRQDIHRVGRPGVTPSTPTHNLTANKRR
jgi:hypothetical protein